MVSKAESEAQYTECQTNDSPIEYNCKISRHKTALTDTYRHRHAVSDPVFDPDSDSGAWRFLCNSRASCYEIT